MKNRVLVDGLAFNGTANTGKANCEVCCEAKQSRLPFQHKGKRAKAHLEVIHTDVCGPMETLSLGGCKYFLLFEDDFSRMSFVYFLKTKDEAFEYFRKFKVISENQTGLKIKKIRSDQGGEFSGNNIESFLEQHGIIHQKTNAYTPEQNGMSERMNRTIVESVYCLMLS